MQLTDLTGRVGPPFCYLGSIVDHQKFLSVQSLSMIGTVGRLERLLEFIGVHMLFDLIIDCPLGELRQKAKIRDRPIVFVSQF